MADDALSARIESMYRGDCRGAWLLVILLWAVTAFVLYMSWPFIPDENVRIVALIAAALVLLFNTASIFALVRHYSEDKEFIYTLDIKHLDALKETRN